MDRAAPDPIARLLADPPDLPVLAGLGELRRLLTGEDGTAATSAAVVTAPPGTGKTTLVPPLVADVVAQGAGERGTGPGGGPARVLVTQPRRLAARAAARRLADLLGQEVGDTVGYAVRGQRRTGPTTRIEVVTAGLLLRRLQAEPDLPGVGAVVLDEVHERSVDSDLLLTLLLDARALREDLILVAMSATADLDRLPALLGSSGAGTDPGPGDAGPGDAGGGQPDTCPVLDIPSPLHPVAEHWAPPPSSVTRLGPHGVPRDFLAHVAATTERALAAHDGDALVFLPGAREVDDVVARLRALAPPELDVAPLHGRLGASAQDAALTPSPAGRRRVVVATNVAESSLTVPRVRIVVDSTLSREPRLDVGSAMSGLVTVGASRAAGVQRAGRAGRQGPGVVYRCCTPTDWARAPQAPAPQILVADLTRTALELAVWGAPGGVGLAWLDAPPVPALTAAVATLTSLGLVDADGAATPLGRAVAGVPADVRPARALLVAAGIVGARRASQATALITTDLRAPGADLTTLARQAGEDAAWRAQAARLHRAVDRAVAAGAPAAAAGPTGRAAGELTSRADVVGLVAALARPEWIARRRGPAPAAGREAQYVSVGGTGMRVPAGSPLAACQWLAVADVERAPGRASALVRAAAPVEEDLAVEVAGAWLADQERAQWDGGRLRCERVRSLGAIALAVTPVAAPQPAVVAQAVLEACRREGLGFVPWGSADGGGRGAGAAELRARLALLHRAIGDPWPAMDDDSLLQRAAQWLVPAVEALAESKRSRSFDVGALDTAGALRALLPWPEAARLDELAPQRLEVPSGSHVAVRYVGEQGEALERPVLAVRVQECFGWEETPRVADGRVAVLLHLLSPARRPVAVTDDLRSFWEGPYQQVRREMRGRYPKHPWPQDPWSAPATRGVRRRP